MLENITEHTELFILYVVGYGMGVFLHGQLDITEIIVHMIIIYIGAVFVVICIDYAASKIIGDQNVR